MQSDAISRAVLDGLGAIVWEARPGAKPGEAHFSFVSEGTQAMLGHPPTAWTADPRFWLEITHPDDRERVIGQILAAARHHRDADFEFRAIHADGHVVWLRNIVRVERDPADDGAPRLSGVVVDVTGRKLAEERLARVHGVTMRLTGLLQADEVAQTVVAEGRAAVGAVGAAVYILEDDRLSLMAAEGYPPEALEEMASIPRGAQVPAAEVVESGLPVWIATAEEAERRYPGRGPGGAVRGASCALPLVAEDRVLGALVVRMPEERRFASADRVVLDVLAVACGQALLLARSLAVEKGARRSAELLAALGPILDEAVSVEQRLERLARALLGPLGDHCTVTLHDVEDRQRVAVAHRDPERERVLAALPPPNVEAVAGDSTVVVEETTDEMLRALSAGGEELELRRALGARSGVVAPMIVRGRRVGTLAVGSSRPRAFGPDEVALVEEVARRAAIAVDNARLFDSERTARERTTRLQTITAALSEALSPADVATTILEQAMPSVGANMGGVWQLNDAGTAIVALAQHGYPDPDMTGWTELPLSQPLPMTDALRDGGVRFLPTLEAKIETWPHLERAFRRAGSGSLAILPLFARGEPVGAISLSFPRPHALGDEDLAFLEGLAAQCAQALERSRLYEAERRVASTLQRSLLPARLPAVEGVELAVRYLAAAGLEAGGDFYEAIQLPGGAIGVAVGDVVGRGATAAAVMGQLRSALRAFAMGGDPPCEVLARLSAFAETVEGALAATAAYAVVEASGDVRYACAGHPWPVVVQSGGGARFLQGGRSLPLACATPARVPEDTDRLEPGDTLLLFTDGLTERRGTGIDVSLEQLRASLGGMDEMSLPNLLDAVVSAQGADTPLDDVALLALRMETAAMAPRHLRIPAEPTAVATARAQMRAWLAEAGTPPDVAADVLLASGEAVANAVEHAYRGAAPGHVDIALRTGSEITVDVRDAGTWKAGRGEPDRGRGFVLMRAVMHAVEIDRSESGTTVSLRRRVADPPAAGRGPVTALREAQAAGVEVAGDAGGVVARVHGDLDHSSAPRVGEELLAATREGALVVDLAEVGYLDSAGARMLVELSRKVALSIAAPPGTAPRRALEAAGLEALLDLRP